MAYLAHDALLRGRELMHLKIGHLQWDPRRPDRCTIHITASKCNKTGPTEEAHIVSYAPAQASASYSSTSAPCSSVTPHLQRPSSH